MVVEPEDDGKVILSIHPAGPGERRLAFAVGSFSLIVFAALVPFSTYPLAPLSTFIPAYQTLLAISDLVTAGLLARQFHDQGSRALLVLAGGYLFTALIVVVHMLTFPGLFAPTGLLGAGPQTTAWLYMAWHGGFPLVLIAFALLKDDSSRPVQSRGPAVLGAGVVVALVVAVISLLATAGQDLLPSIMDGNKYTSTMIFVVGTTWLLSVMALIILWRRGGGSVLDTWLMVVMCAWICDIGLSAVFNAGRFDLGFYAGRIYGLLAGGFVLVVLLEPRFGRSR